MYVIFQSRHSFGNSKLTFLNCQSAIEGSLNVLRQAEKAGVKKFVVTSSIIAVRGDPAKGTACRSERKSFLRFLSGDSNVFPFTYWNPVTLDGRKKEYAYAASKKFAELAVWEWAEAYPDVDVTTSKSIILFFILNLSYKSH